NKVDVVRIIKLEFRRCSLAYKFMNITSVRKSIFTLIGIVLLCPSSSLGQQKTPTVISGTIERIENFPSVLVSPRTIDIWLPAGYSRSKKYSVLYMQDGQMLFDPAQTWNNQAWDIDDIATGLFKADACRAFIVVGIWNGGVHRHSEYFPQRPFESMTPAEQDTMSAQLQRAGRIKDAFMPQSDAYLKFIVTELKPYIDRHYSVKKNRLNTYIGGSSMGALASIYAVCEYPRVFGGAICISTHWVGTFQASGNPIPNAVINYLDQHLPSPKRHKIYFDCGDQTLDALYPEFQHRVDTLMSQHRYHEDQWRTHYFPGADHSERSWKNRLHIPLEFMFE
ncbi:MAG: alpha/beta hydrolase, partial [Flavobacteriales bacterium]